MNEKIKEFAKQADIIQWDILPSGARTPDHESVVKARKFAEMIVKECAKLCDKDYERCGQDGAGWRLARMIEEHFGIE